MPTTRNSTWTISSRNTPRNAWNNVNVKVKPDLYAATADHLRTSRSSLPSEAIPTKSVGKGSSNGDIGPMRKKESKNSTSKTKLK